MHTLQIILNSLITLIVLFFLTKLMGKRQISELSFFDYLIGITVGSAAAEAAFNPEIFWNGLISMAVYALIAVVISIATNHFVALRKIVEGKPEILFESGRFNKKKMKKAHIDLDEFLMACRQNQFFDLEDIHLVILEADGRLSFVPKVEMKNKMKQAEFLIPVVEDGRIRKDGLKKIKKDEAWLLRQLDSQGYKVETAFLAVANPLGELDIYMTEA